MMRPDTEVPSDFQDYTLVALIGVAVHLSGASPSEPAVLPTLVSMFWLPLAYGCWDVSSSGLPLLLLRVWCGFPAAACLPWLLHMFLP